MTRTFLLASAAIIAFPAQAQVAPAATEQPAASQPAPAADDAAEDEEEVDQEITVTGARPRGSVIGTIPPENVLDTRDIRATGATSISELLEAVAPQTG